MKTWAKVGLVFIIVVVGGSMLMAKDPLKMGIRCNTQGDGGTCTIENNGSRTGTLEVDVVMVCQDGEHVAPVSAVVEPHLHVTKIIRGFTPSIDLSSSCAGLDYRNLKVK